jgi:hypothetical protein
MSAEFDTPFPNSYANSSNLNACTLVILKEANMPRWQLSLLAFLFCTSVTAQEPAKTVAERVERTLVKEPKYLEAPKYSLLVLGTDGKVKVWMVEDGKRLFVDKNANGDLTDDGPPLQPSDVRTDSGGSDFSYLLETIAPEDGSKHTKFKLRRWNYKDPTDSYGLSLTLDDQVPMYAGWFGTFWSASSKTAPAIHFGGPLTPRMLRSKEFTVGEKNERLSLAFINPGSQDGAASRLSIEALNPLIVPEVQIEWPAAPGEKPRTTTHSLGERCCYWEFYTTSFQAPADVPPGVAKLTVQFPARTFPFELTTSTLEVPVIPPAKKQGK